MKSDKEIEERAKADVIISTAIIQSPSLKQPQNKTRKRLLENIIRDAGEKSDVILLPAGFFVHKDEPKNMYAEVEELVVDCLNQNMNTVVCLGIDGRNSKDQIGMAIGRQGIIAISRKFYPTASEEGVIKTASSPLSLEEGYPRTLKIKNKVLYLAVCYDSYGIRKWNLHNLKVDVILNLVHDFYPQGYGGSGDVYFAKYGFAGSSMQWGCPTFGAATFFMREIPQNWPSGVIWIGSSTEVQNWKYAYNGIAPIDIICTSYKDEIAQIRRFSI